MIFFVTGASGSGKTACIEDLKKLLPEIKVFDFDDVGVPENADKIWRQKSTESWLKKAIEYQNNNQDVCVCGGAVLGEILACPSAPKVERIAVCLLDCTDYIRIERLRKRDTHGIHQNMLNWAAFLRMHAIDPEWHQPVIKENSWNEMQWYRWHNWKRNDERWKCHIMDSSNLSIKETAKELACWIKGDTTMIAKLLHSLLILPAPDLKKTSNYYEKILNFKAVQYLTVTHPHICLYRDNVEIVLIKSNLKKIQPNRILHGSGYDGYFTTKNVESMYQEVMSRNAKIVTHLSKTNYGNLEFVIEDVDGRWIAIGLKQE